jgi:hypothetical protein
MKLQCGRAQVRYEFKLAPPLGWFAALGLLRGDRRQSFFPSPTPPSNCSLTGHYSRLKQRFGSRNFHAVSF